MERLADFYVKYFSAIKGNLYTNPANGFTSRFLTFQSGARLEIMRMDSVPDTKNDPRAQFTGIIHIAISIGSAEAVDALTARLKADDYEVCGEPRRTGDGYYESCVLDPDGNRVEITI